MATKSILVTGGAGYLGSHVIRELQKNNKYKFTIVDNLSTGFTTPIKVLEKESSTLKFVHADLRNMSDLEKIADRDYDAVLHFASFMSVNESIQNPGKYHENNITGTINLLRFMTENKIDKLIYCSSVAVYSNNVDSPVTEDSTTEPESPYGETKLICEKLIRDLRKTGKLNPIIFRIFNPVGCSEDSKLGTPLKETNTVLVNMVRSTLGLQDFELTCGKLDTKDSSAVRDFFSVLDVVSAFDVSLQALLDGHKGGTYNIGSGNGTSLVELVRMVEKVTGKKIDIKQGEKREGEIASIYADNSKFKEEFAWKPTPSIEDAVQNLVKFYKENPNGYEE